jgi:uncharacterized protein YggE
MPMLLRTLPLLAATSILAFGQTNSNSVTVTASRSMNIQPDQVVISVQVTTPVGGTLDQAVNALQGSGITAANFSGLGSQATYTQQGAATQTVLIWNFSLTVALSDMQSTIGLLSAVQTSNGKQNNGTSISFTISGTQVSPQAAQQQQCSQAGLLSDAKSQAQILATAAGKSLGAVLGMASGVTTTTQGNGLVSVPVSTPSCTLTVKFQLAGM